MKFVLFTQSLISDWNHGNAHFQRGILRELVSRGHQAVAWEPEDSWSRNNLVAEHGTSPIDDFHRRFPELTVRTYATRDDVEAAVDGADVVIVHEWTAPAIVNHLGRRRASGGRFTLLFHDTHHRMISAPKEMRRLELQNYDGILAFGEVLAEAYRTRGWGRRVYTWHEAADMRLCTRSPESSPEADLVWIGNWGDGERNAELAEYLTGPAREAGLSGSVYGVRYPEEAVAELGAAGLAYRGWLPNADAPSAFARHRMTVHVPRQLYATRLLGIPTIRMFEALGCGIPLLSAPWADVEGLFKPGEDYLVAFNGECMAVQLRRLLVDPDYARELGRSGQRRILERHTCTHRVDELLSILAGLRSSAPALELEEAR